MSTINTKALAAEALESKVKSIPKTIQDYFFLCDDTQKTDVINSTPLNKAYYPNARWQSWLRFENERASEKEQRRNYLFQFIF